MPRTFKVTRPTTTKTEGTNAKEETVVKNKNTTKKSENMGVGKLATACLLKGYSYDLTLETVLRVFPTAGTTKNCIYYYAVKAGVTNRSKAQADKKELAKVLKALAS